MQVLSFIGKFSYKHFIAPVKINIKFILPDTEAHLGPIKLFFEIRYNEFLNLL